jgi:hypothetical protein
LNDLSDNADDAHEKSFEVKDPRLLKLDEIESLKDPRKAVEWFTGVYSPKVAYQISKLLSKPDFGLHDETMAEVVANRKFQQLCEANQKHWFEHGRPLPVHGRVSAR